MDYSIGGGDTFGKTKSNTHTKVIINLGVWLGGKKTVLDPYYNNHHSNMIASNNGNGQNNEMMNHFAQQMPGIA